MTDCGGAKDRVLQRLESDLSSADMQWSLFMSALESYRHDSILRPFPSAYVEDDGNKNFQGLVQVCSAVPLFGKILKGKQISQEAWDILDWALDRTFVMKSVDKSKFSEIEEKTGQASYSSATPDFIFEVEYSETNTLNAKFNELSQIHDVWYAYHGSRVDNFHSILNNGLHAHLNKTSFFGEGTYLSSDLTVCMMYSHYGQGWKNSVIGDKISCVAVCEILDHPDVKCTVKSQANSERQNRSRARARNSEGGDVPERYYVVTNNQAVRVKYVLVYAEKKTPARTADLWNSLPACTKAINSLSTFKTSLSSTYLPKRVFYSPPRVQARNWLIFRYPLASIMVAYILILVFVALSRTRLFQKFYSKYFKGS